MKTMYFVVLALILSGECLADYSALSKKLENLYDHRVDRCDCVYGGFIFPDGSYSVQHSRRYANTMKLIQPSNAIAIWRSKQKGALRARASEYDHRSSLPVYVAGRVIGAD